MRQRGKGIFWVGMMMGGLALLAACDDISRPVSDPYLHPPGKSAVEDTLPVKKMSERANVEAYYNFLVENWMILNERFYYLLELREKDPEQFDTLKGNFKDQTYDLIRRLRHQKEAVDFTVVRYPEDHPARQLLYATLLLEEEMDHYIRVFFENQPLDPEKDRKVEEKLRRVRELLENFTGESEETPPPER